MAEHVTVKCVTGAVGASGSVALMGLDRLLRGDRGREVDSRVDAQLAINAPQMVLDGLGTEEERSGSLTGGLAGGEHLRDMERPSPR